MAFASVCSAYAETVHTYDMPLCLSLRRLRLLGLPTSVSPIRWSRTETTPFDSDEPRRGVPFITKSQR
jgi:hypothetical protein